jgi:hypothetical protein
VTRFYVTAVVVVEAETAQQAVDQLAGAVRLDYAGEPIVEVYLEAPDGVTRAVDVSEWEVPTPKAEG